MVGRASWCATGGRPDLSGAEEFTLGNMYILPRGSNHYDEKVSTKHLSMGAEGDMLVGEFSGRPTAGELPGGCKTDPNSCTWWLARSFGRPFHTQRPGCPHTRSASCWPRGSRGGRRLRGRVGHGVEREERRRRQASGGYPRRRRARQYAALILRAPRSVCGTVLRKGARCSTGGFMRPAREAAPNRAGDSMPPKLGSEGLQA